MVLSADSVGLAYLWSRRKSLRTFGDRLHIPRPETEDPLAGLSWMVPMIVSLATVVLVLSFGTILTDSDLARRSSVSQAALAQALAIGLLARGERRSGLQILALGVGVLGAVASGWASLSPDSPTVVLDRLVIVLVVLTAASALYGLGLVKLFRRKTEWTWAARRLVPALVSGAAMVLVVVLTVEVVERASGRSVPISPASLMAVGLALVAGAVSAIVAAVVPGRDPLGLPERKRTLYVYGAEALLALVLLHVWLTLPWLFSNRLAAYWPLDHSDRGLPGRWPERVVPPPGPAGPRRAGGAHGSHSFHLHPAEYPLDRLPPR